MNSIILASASKRRQEILNSLGLKFKVVVSDFDEESHQKNIKNPAELVKKLALEKALAVQKAIGKKHLAISMEKYLIISADTIVAVKDKDNNIVRAKSRTIIRNLSIRLETFGFSIPPQSANWRSGVTRRIKHDVFGNNNWLILGKPKNRQEAKTMLNLLKNRQHEVLTGLTLINSRGESKTIIEKTKVWFNDYTSEALEKYLDKGFYLDRAGGYGIQDEGCSFIKKYEGIYSNILGLPIEKLKELLKEFGNKTKII
jgi:septum formation protein